MVINLFYLDFVKIIKKCDLLYFVGQECRKSFCRIKKNIPNKKIEIFSSDTLKKNKSTMDLLKKVERKEIDILVGTQLLSKGFHFPKLNCIVVVDADFSSHGYDLKICRKKCTAYIIN